MEELELLTPEQVAKILGISINTIYAWTSTGNKRKSMPKTIYIKLGRQIRFKPKALAEWIEEGAELVNC